MREFYEDAYGVVRGCTPSVARGGECARVVHDGFGTARQMSDMVDIAERAMRNLFHQAGFPLHTRACGHTRIRTLAHPAGNEYSNAHDSDTNPPYRSALPAYIYACEHAFAPARRTTP